MPPAYDTAIVGFFVVDQAGQVLGTAGDARTADIAAAFVVELPFAPASAATT
ncbi:MAG: hypothetical protein IPK85_04275 [Gemmatimonadetes bacterium]|nr:hypothetical protein [Gemmatimonadota bacterium]